MTGVIIGVDPHKLSATIEVVDHHEKLLGSGRFSTDQAGYTAMRKYVAAWPDRLWAVEGSNGAGRPLAQRLLEAGERVVDVPAKLSARVRLFDTGHNRKTDARDAHSIAVVAVRTKTLRVLSADGELEALRMLADRREELTRSRVQTVNRLQRLLSELLPGQAKRDITTAQAKALLATVRPRDIAGKTRRRIAAEELRRAGRDRGQDEEVHRRAEGAGPRPPLTADGPARRRARRRREDSGRRRRHRPVRRPEPVRVLDRHRTPRRLLRRADPPPALPGREPADEPHDPHRRDQPDPPRHPRPRLLPTQARRTARHHSKRCAASSAGSPTPSTASSSPTPTAAEGADPGGHCGASHESSAVDSHPPHRHFGSATPGPATPTLRPTTTTRKRQLRPTRLTQRGAG